MSKSPRSSAGNKLIPLRLPELDRQAQPPGDFVGYLDLESDSLLWVLRVSEFIRGTA